MMVLGRGLLHHEAAGEALLGAQILTADLMAHGAGHAVLCLRAFAIAMLAKRQEGEHLALFAPRFRLVARDRHVANGALVLHLSAHLRMIEGFAANAGLPVGIAR